MRKLVVLTLFIFAPFVVKAQMDGEARLMEIEASVLQFITGNNAEDLNELIGYFRPAEGDALADRKIALKQIKEDLQPFLGDVGIEGGPEGLSFFFSNQEEARVLKVMINNSGQIAGMRLDIPSSGFTLTVNLLPQLLDSLEDAGYSGLLYARKKGDGLIEQAFGMANPGMGIPNTTETIFATGSRPIDYTVAAIQLLDQQGELSIEDPITEYFEDVPSDKQNMTLQHLLTGRSGLPDFFDTKEDWDADLAWIDREEATHRLLNIDLIFEPGTNRQHSHAAFGLLAIIVEQVSGMDYYEFLREKFFDPAGMDRTGEYGETRGFSIEDFAEGKGPQRIGLPNIPPNWGPTSWLIKGSGGMYSTFGDLRKFYDYLRSGKVLDEEHQHVFRGESVQLDGSMRGFELFSIHYPNDDTELYLFLNELSDRQGIRDVFRALERFMTE
ncbi:MAG: beta-lactamase family protein [Balneolaceae bacterium]|nr:beta-lactamase family protein [Balneolaceae bacterium]